MRKMVKSFTLAVLCVIMVSGSVFAFDLGLPDQTVQNMFKYEREPKSFSLVTIVEAWMRNFFNYGHPEVTRERKTTIKHADIYFFEYDEVIVIDVVVPDYTNEWAVYNLKCVFSKEDLVFDIEAHSEEVANSIATSLFSGKARIPEKYDSENVYNWYFFANTSFFREVDMNYFLNMPQYMLAKGK